MYLEHFGIKKFPFSITPNTDFFCLLPGHQQALNVLLLSLKSGEGFVKIIGEVGLGKTLLCRFLLDELEEDFITAYIPNPELKPIELKKALAKELQIDDSDLDSNELITAINQQLLKLHQEQKQVVLLIDEAQAMPDETIETLRLLTNLETETTKLLQVVLFGQPELDKKLSNPQLRQLLQRITFSYTLPKLSRPQVQAYVEHRLSKAGLSYGALFSKTAYKMIYKSSSGMPRIINILAHKAMMVSFGRGKRKVNKIEVKRAIADTEAAKKNSVNNWKLITFLALGVLVLLTLIFFVG